ncbi:MAG: InlB B-repeat-containing protein [Clostridia bacterium]|nr:InlB B-repeat-containing protein [Clostridia bacterium]
MKKKILSLALATAVCVSVVACGDASTSSSSLSTTASTVNTAGTSGNTSGSIGSTTGTVITCNPSGTTQTTASTTSQIGVISPDVTYGEFDPVTVDLGGYAKLIFNPACCNITYKIEDGVGAKKNITLNIAMKKGYVFDGWSKSELNTKKERVGGPIANGATADSSEATYTYSVTKSKDTVIWANYSAEITYNPNGGTVAGGGETYTQKYSMVYYKCPNTLPEQGFFTRDGYTLVEYNTKADGSGKAVSLGSKMAIETMENATLYCIWEKQNDSADFETSSANGTLTITKYKGTSDNVVIPEKIDGKRVVGIAGGAFTGTEVKRVVLTKNISNVADGAFANCAKLESFVMFDNLVNISDDSFTGSSVKNLRVNAALNLYNNWTVSYAAPKMDRLIWAKANGKKVIAIYGGSGSLYGWDCEAIEEAFGGEYVVVNLGTNANATATMFFDCFADILTKDDVVLWAPEPGEWTFGSTAMGSMWGGNPKSWEINAAHYDIFRDMDISEYTKVFDSYASYASAHKNAQKKYDAFSESTSVHGDGIDNTTSNGGGYTYANEYERREKLFTDGTLDYIAELIGKLDANGVKVFHTYAAMDANGKSSIDSDYIKNTFEKVFENKFKGIEMISDIMDCFVPSTQIRDSAWHLTRDGAEARTAVVIEDLKEALGK